MRMTPSIPEDAVFSFRSVSFTLGELAILGTSCGVLIVAAIVALIYLSRKDREQVMGGDELFERELLSELGPGTATLPVAASPRSAAPQAPLATRPSPSGSAAAWMQPAQSGSPVDDLVARLRGMGLLGEFRGTMTLSFPPNGQIYALANGGTIVVLPRMETEAFLAHATNEHAMVVVPATGGEALVITKLGHSMSVKVEQTS